MIFTRAEVVVVFSPEVVLKMLPTTWPNWRMVDLGFRPRIWLGPAWFD
jgi:hypothetical protein